MTKIDLDQTRASAEGAQRRGANLSVDPETMLAFVDTVKAIRFFWNNQGQGRGGPLYSDPLIQALKKFKDDPPTDRGPSVDFR